MNVTHLNNYFKCPTKSVLDTDIYKFYMLYAVTKLYPNVNVSYKFKNRGPHRFNKAFMDAFEHFINFQIQDVKLTDREADYLRKICPFFTPDFISYLKEFRFDPSQVHYFLDDEDNLVLDVSGLWRETIMWEIVLMAAISELYFKTVDTTWNTDMEVYRTKTQSKFIELQNNGVTVADFSTRRRRSFEAQAVVVEVGKAFKNFIGTSNVYLAMLNEVRAIGTTAHEFIQAVSALESLNHPNRLAMQKWSEVYRGELGIALPDTFGTDAFLKDFDIYFAKMFDGVRQDSGKPLEFADKFIAHYKKLGIDPMTKTLVFSDSLNVKKAIEINEYCKGKIKASMGIGTFFSNDFENSPALNMVIKLWSVNDFYVVKLSDDNGKENGEAKSVEFHKWLFGRK